MPINSGEKDFTDDAVGNTVTLKDVLRVAQRITGDSTVKVLEYHLDAYSEEKIGFMGTHQKLKILVQKSTDSEPETLYLFVKSIPYFCGPQTDFIKKDNIFEKETAFFEKIVPWITENYEGEKWSPTCYLVTKDALIMEDLKHQGYAMLDNSFNDLEILKSGLATLARLHSCSFLTKARLKQQSKVLALNEFCPESCTEAIFNRARTVSRWFSAGVEVAAVVAERLGYDSRRVRLAIDRMCDLVKPSKKYPNVISHGDLWKNNLMFDNSSPRKCVLVDFQVVRYGPISLDILMFLYLNSTSDFRKAFENDLIESYHLVLETTIKLNDKTGLIWIPTLEEIKNEIEEFRIYGSIIATLYFPISLLDPKIAKENTEDPDKYEQFIFGNKRIDVTLDYMRKNEFYRTIIEDNITEIVEISKRSEI